jgi:hypothetical protein
MEGRPCGHARHRRLKSTRPEAHLAVRATYQPYLSTTTGTYPSPSQFRVLFPIPATGDVKGVSGGEGGEEAVGGGAARHRRRSRPCGGAGPAVYTHLWFPYSKLFRSTTSRPSPTPHRRAPLEPR